MKNLNTALILALVLTSFSVNAQTERTFTKKSATATTINKENATMSSVASNEKNDYMSAELEKEIKGRLISGKIPASLPKYTSGTSEEDYKKILIGWARKNISLVKEEYRDEVLGNNKKASNRTK